jgi:hypothetical protein
MFYSRLALFSSNLGTEKCVSHYLCGFLDHKSQWSHSIWNNFLDNDFFGGLKNEPVHLEISLGLRANFALRHC